jgi:hypothetical protein
MHGNASFVAAGCALCVNKEISILKREITFVNSPLRLQTLGENVGNVYEESRKHAAARTSGHGVVCTSVRRFVCR